MQQESDGDKRYHLPPETPLITPERASKGDVLTGPPCKDCGASGKSKEKGAPHTALCRTCRGRGWVGSTNATDVPISDIRFAQVHEKNLLNCLWNAEQITDQQHHDGGTFQIWRDMHRVQMGLQRPVCSGEEEGFGVRLRAYGYIILIRKLNRYEHHAIEASLQPMMQSYAEWIARNRVEKYVSALDRLSRILPAIKDQITYLEGLDDEQREELSKESINKLLATIKKS